jgi:Right handed beta helix region/Immunoglobulin domain
MPRFLAALVALLIAHCALADTIIPGGAIATQTWTLAGSPYVIQGDITIPEGSTLTIQPGVLIDFGATDSMAGGIDPTLSEITVQGSLICSGTAAQPIIFRGAATANLYWYGIVVDTNATACFLSNTTIRFTIRGLYSKAAGSAVLQASDVTIERCQEGVHIDAGTPLLTRLTIHDFCCEGIWAYGSGGLNLTDSFIYQTSPGGNCLNVTTSAPSVVTHCTISGGGIGVNHYGTGSLALYNCICQNAGFRGITHSTSGGMTGTMTIDHCDVWNSPTNYFGCSPGPGCISVNPMLVSNTDAHLTIGSPCMDTGTAAHTTATDRYGVSRPQDGDFVGGPVPDIGAAEFSCTTPVISQDPAPAAATVGQRVTFHAAASITGTSLTYQWRSNGVNLVNQGAILGVNTATLVITACSLQDAGSYDVVVSGCYTSVPSNTAALTVSPAPRCGSADFDGDGDLGTDADIEAFFRVLAGGPC